MSETIREEKAVNSTDAPGLNFESPNKRFDPATLEALRVLQSITKPDLFAADPALAEHAQTLLSLKTSLPPPTSSLLLPPQPVGDVRTSDIAAVAVAKSAIPVSLDIFPSPTPTPVVSHTHQFVPSTYVTCDHIVSSQPTQSSNQQSQQATKLRSETTMEGNNNGYPHSIEMMEDHQFDEQSDQPPLTLPEHSQLSLPVLAATELAKPVTTVAPAVQQQEPVVSPVKPQQTGAPAFNVPQDPRLPAASSATNQQQQQQQQQRPQRHPLPPRPTFALPPRPPTGLWAQHYQSSSSQPGPGSSNSGISFMQEEVVEEVSSGSVPPGQPQRSFSDPASQPYDPLNPDSTDHSVSSMGAPSSSSFSGPTAAASNGAVEDLQHNTPDMNAAGSASPSSSTLSPLLSGSIGETPVPLFTIDKTRSDSNAMVVDGPTTPSTGMSTDTGVDAVMKQGSQPPIPAASAPGSNIAGTGPNKKNGTGGGGGPSGGNKKDRTALTGDPHQFHPTHTVTFAAHPSVIGKLPPGSRLFLGNLASERTDKGEVASIFAQYGNIVEILFKGSYGFIQYDNPTSCREAIRCEQGRVLGGINLGEFSK
ncbi:hypothetical protein HK102_009590 [Quaeritorhiza haematococci]|nr:hypothetical protein HK102_009590 [Quaeritorhiza haematococci]